MNASVRPDRVTAEGDTERAVTETLQRAGMYRVLAAAFSYPTAPRVDEAARATATLLVVASGLGESGPLSSPRAAAPRAITGAPSAPCRQALAAFAAAAFQADPDKLGEEYVFLFDRQVRCPPRESAWGDAPMMAGAGAALADIGGFYSAFGLEVGGQPETEDHVSAELEFMSALALKEAWARGDDDGRGVEITRAAARAFLTDHLGRWAEVFAEQLQAATPVPFYVAAARLLVEWIRAEIDALGAVPARVRGRIGADPLQADAFTCPMGAPEPAPDAAASDFASECSGP